jgi:uncharacterized protein YndB with AHSA1/START domain
VMVNDADPSQTSPVDAVFVEVVENELLVGSEKWEGVPGLQDPVERFTLRLEFHDESDGRTRLVLRQGPYSREMVDMAHQGWESSFTKLDKLLA